MKRLYLYAAASVVVLAGVIPAYASTPNIITYQGRLLDSSGNPAADGVYLIRFRLYDAPIGGTVLWDSNFRTVNVTGGLLSYPLGDSTALPVNLFRDHTELWLGIKVGTDPELSPRVKLTSAAFARQAQKSDTAMLARDADSLGGSGPAFYRDWNNLTNVPTGFADGVDNVGTDSLFVDSTFVHSAGDTVNGSLYFDVDGDGQYEGSIYDFGTGIDFILRQQAQNRVWLFGETWGTLYMYDSLGTNPSVQLDASPWTGGTMHLTDLSYHPTMSFRGAYSGDGSVHLPDSAISSAEILDEPGIAKEVLFIKTISSVSADSVVDSITISAPGPGYVLIQATGMLTSFFSSVINNPWTRVSLGRDPNTLGNSFVDWEVPTSQSGSYLTPFAVTYTDTVSAGSHTFYMNATKGSSAFSASVQKVHLTAMFFPTAYGSVYLPAPPPPSSNTTKALSPTGDDLANNTRLIDYRPIIEAKQAERIRKLEERMAKLERKLQRQEHQQDQPR